MIVCAPALHASGVQEGAGMLGGNLQGGGTAREPYPILRNAGVAGRPVTELPVPPMAPALDTAARDNRTGDASTGGDRDHAARQTADINRRGAAGGRAIAELSDVI